MKNNDSTYKQNTGCVFPKGSIKEYGISKEVINSITLFIYNRNYKQIPNAFEIYNDWVNCCKVFPDSIEGIVVILELIRKIAALDREEQRKALEFDHFL